MQAQGITQFDRLFPSDKECEDYVERLRWPNGFECRNCGSKQAWQTGRGQMRCSSCQYQSSITAGTIFEGTRKPLRDWFRAIWYVSGRKSGVSALGLQRELNLPSYETAWKWLHKLRTVMVLPEMRVRGQVQVDQIALKSRLEPAARNLPAPVVVIAAEVEGRGLGRIQVRQVTEFTGEQLFRFIEDVVEPAASVETWFWQGPAASVRRDGNADTLVLSSVGGIDRTALSHPGYVGSTIDRWLRGTYCQAMDLTHLGFYLDEFTFRSNHRKKVSREELFRILVSSAVMGTAVSRRNTSTYKDRTLAVAAVI